MHLNHSNFLDFWIRWSFQLTTKDHKNSTIWNLIGWSTHRLSHNHHFWWFSLHILTTDMLTQPNEYIFGIYIKSYTIGNIHIRDYVPYLSWNPQFWRDSLIFWLYVQAIKWYPWGHGYTGDFIYLVFSTWSHDHHEYTCIVYEGIMLKP